MDSKVRYSWIFLVSGNAVRWLPIWTTLFADRTTLTHKKGKIKSLGPVGSTKPRFCEQNFLLCITYSCNRCCASFPRERRISDTTEPQLRGCGGAIMPAQGGAGSADEYGRNGHGGPDAATAGGRCCFLPWRQFSGNPRPVKEEPIRWCFFPERTREKSGAGHP